MEDQAPEEPDGKGEIDKGLRMTRPSKFSRHTQRKALDRQGNLCASCGAPISSLGEAGRSDHRFGEGVHAHHVRHVKFKGSDSIDNCVILCQSCHYSAHEGGNYRFGTVIGCESDYPHFHRRSTMGRADKKTFRHLSRYLMDFWFNELLRKNGCTFEACKRRVKQNIRSSYLEYMRVMANRRTRLIKVKAQMLGTMARGKTALNDIQSATKELDAVINNLAVLAQMTFSVCKLVKPAVAVSVAVRRAVNNKSLIRESNKYWPSVNQLRAVWNAADKERVRGAVKDLAKEATEEARNELLIHFINELTHLLEPSYWARKMLGMKPEDLLAQQQREVENVRKKGELVANEQIAELDAQITRARKEMNELLKYIEGCYAGPR